ncbi:MAG: hypothetical protein SFZ24_07300 [Planctomycetota bacterium]|nr:hypothetical protein [Planctomycetota bacterium]
MPRSRACPRRTPLGAGTLLVMVLALSAMPALVLASGLDALEPVSNQSAHDPLRPLPPREPRTLARGLAAAAQLARALTQRSAQPQALAPCSLIRESVPARGIENVAVTRICLLRESLLALPPPAC